MNLQQCCDFIKNNKTKIIKFLQDIIRIKSYSSEETQLVKFILHFLKTDPVTKKLCVKRVKNNILIFLPNKPVRKVKLIFDAHIDTVPAENNRWKFPPFSGKLIGDKLYGRGAADDKSSVAALVFTAKFLAENKYKGDPVVFSLSSNEEDSSGKGITEVLKFVKPEYCIICEPSDLKIVYGHKGKWCIKLTFYGKPAHSSLPQYGKNAIYAAYPLIKKIVETKPSSLPRTKLGRPTFTITYINSETNSLNTLPHKCSVYIDYRSVPGETEESIKEFLVKNLKQEKFKFEPVHRFFPAWILQEKHTLISSALETYKICFGKETKPILWQFCTNGSVTMAEHNIPTIGFGPGSPFVAHQNNEYVNITDVLESIKFYSLIAEIIHK